MGTGLTATMAALVLALLIASAKSSCDAQRNDVTQISANVILLDRVLAHYGPETNSARALSVSGAIYLILELDRCFAGLLQVSDASLRNAITHLGR